MAEEFNGPSTDFEAWVGEKAAEAVNGDGPHFQPPPEPTPETPPPARAVRNSSPHGGDPLLQLEALARDLPLLYREMGDINASLMKVQLTSVLTIGSMFLLAVLVYKLANTGKE